jgi:multidrug efflux pump subunit AcrA (membrane-fusion protein)
VDTQKKGLGALSRADSVSGVASVPRPVFRWTTRVLLPVAILGAGAALLAYSARSVLTPAVDVHVVPVVAKAPVVEEPGEEGAGTAEPAAAAPVRSGGAGGVMVQAPGWIEPAPFAASIAALTEGVVSEVLVLEGERVEKGQVVARLIDADAKLRLQRSEAELAEAEAAVAEVTAQTAAATARVGEVQQELDRRRPLIGSGVVAEGEISQLERRLKTAEMEVAVSRATMESAKSRAATHRVICDEARLALSRTEIVSPVAGVVLSRRIEPGVRIAMSPPGAGEAREPGVMRVYDPENLQVRVDVPLADAAKVGVGTHAEITTEALPDLVLTGTVVRVVHEADIQRNTVQFKVAIEAPTPLPVALKPEMLTKVRFHVGARDSAAAGGTGTAQTDGLRLLVPENILIDRAGEKAKAWVVDQSGSSVLAVLREVSLAGGGVDDEGNVEVVAGLKPGDRLIADPPPKLRAGARIRVSGEHELTSN